MSGTIGSPEFYLESDRAIVVLGNSERREVGEFLLRTLADRGLFPENLELFTLNQAAKLAKKSLAEEMRRSTVITHSAGIMYVPEALQIVALNPPEPVPLFQLMRRAIVDIASDPIVPEDGAHQSGVDMLKACVELGRSPITSVKTPLKIALGKGYSATKDLSEGAERFPAGRAMVHAEYDSFGFAVEADMKYAANHGVHIEVTPGYHNEVLFAPNRIINRLTPRIFRR